VNFFCFVPRIPTPVVAPVAYFASVSISTAKTTDAEVMALVDQIQGKMSLTALRSLSSKYDGGQALAKDCASAPLDVRTILGSAACQLTATPARLRFPSISML